MDRFRALPAHLGGKRRLCPLIFAVLDDQFPRRHWRESSLLDPFSGGGSVALYAKAQGFRVVSADIAERAVVVGRALIANSSARLQEHDVLDLFRPVAGDYPRPAAGHVPSVFTTEQADWLDQAMARANLRVEPIRSLLLLVVIKLALSLHPMSLPTASDAAAAATGDFDRISPRRLGHYLKARARTTPRVALQCAADVNSGVFGGTGASRRGDALSVIASTEAEVVYLDPPYAGTTGYADTYRVIDELLGQPPLTSPPPTLDELLDVARQSPWLVLSYGGRSVTLASLVELVGRHRRVARAFAVPYAHLAAVATEESRARNREYLIVAH